MDINQIIALHQAGFSVEQIQTILTALPGAPADPEPSPDPQPDPEPSPDPQPAPAQHEDAPPAWFNQFVQRYEAEQAALQRAWGVEVIKRTEEAQPPKTNEQLMAEAFAAIR